MKSRKKYNATLILFYILLSYGSIPLFIGLESVNQPLAQNNQASLDQFELDDLPDKSDEGTQLNTETSLGEDTKYDESLKSHLQEVSSEKNGRDLEKVKTIVMFDEGLSKKKRLDILQSHFTDFEVIYNYDIISGMYLQVDPYELMDAESEIAEIKAIKKVYKSKTFSQPVITEEADGSEGNSITPSALEKENYPNWWLSSIGGDSLSYDGSGVTVAIIDSGVYNHSGLNIVDSIDAVGESTTEDKNGHGTHCAGIAAGDGAGSDGEFRGVAPGAGIINVRAADSNGALRDSSIINGIQEANDAGADIISMSFGGGQPAAHDPITAPIDVAVENGTICVVSAGNSGPEYFTGGSPAAGTSAISVGASNRNDELASFSSWGPTYTYLGYPDVVAPGVDIISCEAKDSVISGGNRFIGDYFDFEGDADYLPLSGTSMSCPMVAGALAILKDFNSSITPETARIALLEGARSLTDSDEDDILKSGAGIINVSASLEFLKDLEDNEDVNEVAKVYPGVLPVEPYDLLNFPGDHQQYNLTLISGSNRTYNIDIPSVEGLTINLDKNPISFSNPGVNFSALDIKIDNDAKPGLYDFQINLTSDELTPNIVNTINVSFEIKLPEYSVLMDSFHGLNDFLPEISFYQMDFYESMKKMASENVSLDYNAVSWTPNYDAQLNNSMLTEERLGQYDLVVLQSPILPYSPREMDALNSYFSNGSNLLFMGTRSEQLCKDNINNLLSTLGTGIQVADANIMDDEWLGLGASVTPQSVTDLNHGEIFSGVNGFSWSDGTALSTSEEAESIASLDGETVAASYDGSSDGKGKLVAFGDLHWMGKYYDLSDYESEHSLLMENLINYYQNDENVSIQTRLRSQQTTTGTLDLSLYAKYATNNSLIPSDILNDSLSVALKNNTNSENINMFSPQNGTALNNSYTISSPSNEPYTIEANLTVSGTTYNTSSKLLYYNSTLMPKIQELTADENDGDPYNITRESESVEIEASSDDTYEKFDGHLAFYADSFFNQEQTYTTNITLVEEEEGSSYSNSYDPSPDSVPAGLGMVYITPNSTEGSYKNAFVPRENFYVYNNPPEFNKDESSFSIDSGNEVSFTDITSDEGGSYIYETIQEDIVNFKISVEDSVNYEDDPDDMRVFVNFFICSASSDNYVSLIYPAELLVSEVDYDSESKQHEGSITIPKEMKYPSITGAKNISTETDIQSGGSYLGLLYISVYDNEGGVNEFTIFLAIDPIQETEDWLLWLVLIIIIAVLALIVIAIIVSKKREENRYTNY
ncbi:MAG: S8 family serine peptidase [Promethearchaeia archaeon]